MDFSPSALIVARANAFGGMLDGTLQDDCIAIFYAPSFAQLRFVERPVSSGYYVGLVGPLGVSRLLDGLNSSGRREAAHVYSIWSTADEVIGGGDLVWGRYTSPIPGQDGEIRFGGYPYGHMNSKNLTAAQQLRLVRDHVLTP